MKLQDYVQGDDGLPIAGATVEVYGYGGGVPVATTVSESDGRWVIDGLAPGQYRVRLSWGGQERWIESRAHVQLAGLVGADGVTAPLGAQTVTAAMLVDGAVGSKTETVNPDLAGGAPTAPVVSHLSWLARQVRAALGVANWYDTLATAGLAQRGLVGHQTLTADQAVAAGQEGVLLTGPALSSGTHLVLATVVLAAEGAGEARLYLGPVKQVGLPTGQRVVTVATALSAAGQVSLRLQATAGLTAQAGTSLTVVRLS